MDFFSAPVEGAIAEALEQRDVARATAARLARYGGAEGDVTNDTFRDPAGNVFGVFNY